MTTRSIVAGAIFVAIAVAAFAAPSAGSEPAASTYESYWHRRDWKWETTFRGHLRHHAGSHNYEAVLDDPDVRPNLNGVFGPHLPQLLRNILTYRWTIDLEGPRLVLYGSGEFPARERAILVVDLIGNRVQGAIYSEGQIIVFSDQSDYDDLPPALLRWVREKEINSFLTKEPERNFRLIKERFR